MGTILSTADGRERPSPLHGFAEGAITNTGSSTPTVNITDVSAFSKLWEQFDNSPNGKKLPYHVKVVASGDAYLKFNATTGNNQIIHVSATLPFEADLEVKSIYYGATGTPTLDITLL